MYVSQRNWLKWFIKRCCVQNCSDLLQKVQKLLWIRISPPGRELTSFLKRPSGGGRFLSMSPPTSNRCCAYGCNRCVCQLQACFTFISWRRFCLADGGDRTWIYADIYVCSWACRIYKYIYIYNEPPVYISDTRSNSGDSAVDDGFCRLGLIRQ